MRHPDVAPMPPLAAFLGGGELGQQQLVEESAADKARKWCRDYALPAAACDELIKCLQSRSFESCIKTLFAAAITAGCTAVTGWPKLCGLLGNFISSFISTTGKIGGCVLMKARSLDRPPSTLIDAIAILNPGELLTVGRIEDNVVNRVYTWMQICDEGDIKMIDTVTAMNEWIARGGDWSKFVVAAKDWSDPSRIYIAEERDVQFVSGGKVFRLPQLVPWNRAPYRIDFFKVGEAILPRLTQTGPPMLVATPLIPAGVYPAGTVAVHDAAIGKFRLIAPA